MKKNEEGQRSEPSAGGYRIPLLPLQIDLESVEVLRQVNRANKALAELKGLAGTIPNEHILISTLTLQEARKSSEVENIVTTQDDLFQADLQLRHALSSNVKEVLNYREAIQYGFDAIRKDKLITNNKLKRVQELLEENRAGFRTVPGTSLKNIQGEVVYTPPQDGADIVGYMENLEAFINDAEQSSLDPLIKMAIIHHQFESIHPFYDGNGRTGRILNILYLVVSGLLDLPILYLSRYITQYKADYYHYIQAIRDAGGDNTRAWEDWILFILRGVEQTAVETIQLVRGIGELMAIYKVKLRNEFGSRYTHELLNNLFFHPYTKIGFMQEALGVQRKTATSYLNQIVELGLLKKLRFGRENYYINSALVDLLRHTSQEPLA
nr:Fic family protein [uncultured Porphyromonas sp.]